MVLRAKAVLWATVLCVIGCGLGGGGAIAQNARDGLQIPILYINQAEEPRLPLSLVEPVVTDQGVQGARMGIKDNNGTGRFLKHDYKLTEAIVPEDGDPVAAAKEQLKAGTRLIVADLHADQLLAVADLPEASDALIFNARAKDDPLRNESCRANVFHLIPSRRMLADALAQYLVWKKWREWFLVSGSGEGDRAFAEALRGAAEKFGAKIVDTRDFEGDAPSARTDSGHVQIQKQMPVFTQDADEHDVLVVADESDVFGEYLPYRTWDPRPVTGTQGLIPTAWHRSHEQWGGTQMQRRFGKLAGRSMTERDYTAWAAVRSIGEAVTRIGSTKPQEIKAYLLGDDFKLAAFKGVGLTFRRWNQQLRQPVLLAAPRALISVSPQDEFLHERTPLDTLGYDQPDSSCKLQ